MGKPSDEDIATFGVLAAGKVQALREELELALAWRTAVLEALKLEAEQGSAIPSFNPNDPKSAIDALVETINWRWDV